MFDGFSFSYSHFSSLKQLSGFKSYGAFSLQLSFTICQHQQLTPWLVMANRAPQHPQTQHLQGHTATVWGSQKCHSQVDHPPWEPRGGKLTTAQNSLSGAQHWEPHCSDGCVGTTEGQNELQNDHSKRPRNKMLLKENIFSSGFAYCYFLLTFTDCSPPFPKSHFEASFQMKTSWWSLSHLQSACEKACLAVPVNNGPQRLKQFIKQHSVLHRLQSKTILILI